MDPLWLFLPVLLVVGVITSYTDYSFYKIKNKWIIFGLIYGVMVNLMIFFIKPGFLDLKTISGNDFFIATLVNFVMATLLGIFFWLATYWSAADAKLFTVFSFLVPVTAYYRNTIEYFPAIIILIHTFAILIIILVYQMIRASSLRAYKEGILELLAPKKIQRTLLVLFIIHWVYQLATQYFGFRSNMIMYILFLFMLKPSFKYVFRYKTLLVIVAILRIFFDPGLYTLDFVWQFLGTTLFFLVAIFFFDIMPKMIFDKKIPVSEIEAGMILGEDIYKYEGKLYTKEELEKKNLKGEVFLKRNPHGLSKEEAKSIKRAYKNNKFAVSQVRKSTHTFLAPHLFVGTLITLIAGGNVLVIISNLL